MTDHCQTFEVTNPLTKAYADFIQTFFDLPCTHFWRGHGSAMFLEFGALRENGLRRDGSRRNPIGEWSLYLDFSWRIQGKRLIWRGSGDDEAVCEPVFKKLVGIKVHQCTITGRVPEINLEFENKLHILTFAAYAGTPGWSLIRHLSSGYEGICSRNGQLAFDTCLEQDA